MASYLSPGVYVEEISTGPRPIEAVGTSTTAFLGVAPKADAHLHEPLAVNNWAQFVREFSSDDAVSTPLALAVYGFFDNGGSRCFVVNVGAGGSIAGKVAQGRRQGIATLEAIDEVAIVAAPGFADAGAYDTLLGHCEKMKDRVAILDSRQEVTRIEDLTKVATVSPPKPDKPPPAGGGGDKPPPAGGGAEGLRPRQSDGGYGAFYFPWISVRDPLAEKETYVWAPPCGHVAGIYARTDAWPGVHKAPANAVVKGAGALGYDITPQEQEVLNPAGVNCIRSFQPTGIRVWGARTVAESASEWRYVNVRRLFNMVEKSIGRATRWVVFEPNDLTLWKSIRRDIGAFLTRLWRTGALMGARAEEAFFVKCDEETNPPDVIDAGQVVTLIGIAPVKPAEFVIFRIGQHAGGTQIE